MLLITDLTPAAVTSNPARTQRRIMRKIVKEISEKWKGILRLQKKTDS